MGLTKKQPPHAPVAQPVVKHIEPFRLYKTEPKAHQAECLKRFGEAKVFALLAGMGTGKTWIILNNAAQLWRAGKIVRLFVLAPNGVQIMWVKKQITAHMPEWCHYRAAYWSGENTKEERDAVTDLISNRYDDTTLRILTMNWEALSTKKGQETARAFCDGARRKLMIAADESDNMKNPSAQRTKAMMKLKLTSTYRRIMTGTPTDGTPFSLFSQFNWLDEKILGITSYTAFRAEYGVLLPPSHPLMIGIMQKHNMRFSPPILQTDEHGRPMYKNLDRLRKKIQPYSFRVLKEECLDLPPKIYEPPIYFHLTPIQRAVYNQAQRDLRLEYEGELTPFTKLVIASKLAQITSGYYLHPNSKEPVRIDGANPKLDLLIDRVRAVLEEGKQIIIWARYTIQIEDIVKRLREMPEKPTMVSYYGVIKKIEREHAVDAFESGQAQVFVGNQQAGGSGITLVAASYVAYFSNNWAHRDRRQSEDRAHRMGLTHPVTYLDFVALNSVDEDVAEGLEYKQSVEDVLVTFNPLKGTR